MKRIRLFEEFEMPFFDSNDDGHKKLLKNLGIEGESYYDYFEKGNEDGPKRPSGKIPSRMTKDEWYNRLKKFMPETYNKYLMNESWKSIAAGALSMFAVACYNVTRCDKNGNDIEINNSMSYKGVITDLEKKQGHGRHNRTYTIFYFTIVDRVGNTTEIKYKSNSYAGEEEEFSKCDVGIQYDEINSIKKGDTVSVSFSNCGDAIIHKI